MTAQLLFLVPLVPTVLLQQAALLVSHAVLVPGQRSHKVVGLLGIVVIAARGAGTRRATVPSGRIPHTVPL